MRYEADIRNIALSKSCEALPKKASLVPARICAIDGYLERSTPPLQRRLRTNLAEHTQCALKNPSHEGHPIRICLNKNTPRSRPRKHVRRYPPEYTGSSACMTASRLVLDGFNESSRPSRTPRLRHL
ncbi:hypothetical protein AB1N83_011968 [Pleurotus pulmonarius]